MKISPKDLDDLKEDLKGVIQRHPDVIRAEPEITKHIVKARDLAVEKLKKITEKNIDEAGPGSTYIH